MGSDTLHWSDSRLEIHKVVVGPYDNNVFVLRCKETGDAVLLDAANEHELLLELCEATSACSGSSRPTATATTSRPCPAMREAGYEVGRHRPRRADAARTSATTCSSTTPR